MKAKKRPLGNITQPWVRRRRRVLTVLLRRTIPGNRHQIFPSHLQAAANILYFLKINVSCDTGAPFITAGHLEDVNTRSPGPLDRTFTNKSSSFVFQISLFFPSRLQPVQTELFFTQLTPNSLFFCDTQQGLEMEHLLILKRKADRSHNGAT